MCNAAAKNGGFVVEDTPAKQRQPQLLLLSMGNTIKKYCSEKPEKLVAHDAQKCSQPLI